MSAEAVLLHRIRTCDDFTAAERRIAGFYEDTYPGVALLNLEEVRAAIGVSTASVTRFAKKLGYENFKDLSRAIRAEVRDSLDSPSVRLGRHGPIGPGQAAAQGLSDRFTEAAADLRDTARGTDLAAFERVVELFGDSNRPLLLGAVASGQPLLDHVGLLLSYLRGA